MSLSSKSNEAVSATPREDIIFTDLDGSEGVLVDLNSKRFYQLNETAILIWRGLEKRMTIDMIAQEMTELYEVSLDHARSSVEDLLASFKAQKLVRLS
jgi:hypothetical protein